MPQTKRIILFALFIVSLTFLTLLIKADNLLSFGGCEPDCAKCHSLSDDEALEIMKTFDSGVKVNNIQISPSKGLWEVELERGGKKSLVYIDFSKENLIVGQIVQIKSKKNLTHAKVLELNKVDVSLIPLDDAIVLGKRDAEKKVILFDDPDCPYCKKLHHALKDMLKTREDIAIYIKMFPLMKIHPDAYQKAKIIICDKSIQTLEDAFDKKGKFKKKPFPEPSCNSNAVDENIKLAKSFGITGTPTIILPDGRVLTGAIDPAAILQEIDNK